MDKERRRVGYPTSAAELEDKFLEISQLLDAEKTSWGKLRQQASAISNQRYQELDSMMAQSHKPRVELIALAFQEYQFAFTVLQIAKLGEDVSETHKRLAKVEKAVKELKLALKA